MYRRPSGAAECSGFCNFHCPNPHIEHRIGRQTISRDYATGSITGFRGADAEMTIAKAKQQPPENVLGRLALATAYATEGNNPAALDILDKISDERSGMAVWTKIGYSRFPGMVSDPRFQALLRRIGLPD